MAIKKNRNGSVLIETETKTQLLTPEIIQEYKGCKALLISKGAGVLVIAHITNDCHKYYSHVAGLPRIDD